jgi:hypothetical protein
MTLFLSGIYTNMGNYKSFGDSKFVPDLPPGVFENIVKKSKAWSDFKPLNYQTYYKTFCNLSHCCLLTDYVNFCLIYAEKYILEVVEDYLRIPNNYLI